MFQVVATDLDGTLLGPDGEVDAFTAGTMRDLDARGIQIVLATARHHLDAAHHRDALGIRAYLITSNGARVHDPDGGQILAEDIDPAVARALLRPEVAGDRLIVAFSERGWLLNRPFPALEAYCQRSRFAAEVRDLASHDGEGLAQVMYWGAKDELVRAAEDIQGRFAGRIRVTFTTDRCFDIMTRAVSKGRALTEILRRMDLPASRCVAFGDGHNDIDMLSVAGRPFVMSGSSPELLAAFPHAAVAGSNGDAGVARTLRGLLGLGGDPPPLNPSDRQPDPRPPPERDRS